MAHLAAEILRDPDARHEEKSLAGSVLAQVDPSRESSEKLAHLAAEVMRHSDEYSKNAVSLAASVLSQAK